jgi:hypothetical protein
MKAVLLVVLAVASSAACAQSACVVLAANEPAKGSAMWTQHGAKQAHMLTYLAGEFPKDYSFKSYLPDKDVDKIKQKGGHVLILDPHYTREDLDKAKKECGH